MPVNWCEINKKGTWNGMINEERLQNGATIDYLKSFSWPSKEERKDPSKKSAGVPLLLPLLPLFFVPLLEDDEELEEDSPRRRA